jgi:hypothetical protein
MYKFSSLLCSLFLIAGSQVSQAQSLGNSPYSKLGMGEVNTSTGTVRNFGMGNLGVSTPNAFSVNVQNPALLYYNGRVIFEMAVAGQTKNIQNSTTSENTSNASLGYIALALPITKSWRTAIGIRPYSSVNYNSSSQSTVPGSPEQINVITGNNGEGTISEAFFSNGVKIYKGLSVGVTGSYIFGGINRNAYSQLQDSIGQANPQRVVLSDQTNISDVIFRGGLSYRHAFNKKLNATVGAVYGLQSNVNYKRGVVQERRRAFDNYLIDSVSVSKRTSGEEVLPGFYEAGISFDNNNSWVVGIEYSARKWANYRSATSIKDPNLTNSTRIAVGGELTPDAASVNSYLKRVSYRAGFSYTKTPYMPNGNQLTDVALHAGITLPVGSIPRPPEYNQSFINLGVAVGRNGTTEGNLVRENYIRFMIGLSLNNSWFIKPKFD